MRVALLLVAVGACKGRGPEFSDEQLRGYGLNIAGHNVVHDAEPSLEAGTLLTGVPLVPQGVLPGTWIDVLVVSPDFDWTVELVGDPELLLWTTPVGTLDGISCEPTRVGTFTATLVVTAGSQPGREFRAPIRCESDDAVRFVPLWRARIDDDGSLAGIGDDDFRSELSFWSPGDDGITTLPERPGTRLLEPGFVDGGIYGVSDAGPFHLVDGVATPLADPGTIASAWASPDADQLWVSNGSRLSTVTPLEVEPDLFFGIGLVVQWAASDGSRALLNYGTQAAELRTLELFDADGTVTPFTRFDGSPWATGFGPRGLELSPDGTRALLMSSFFGEVGLELHDLETGAITELLEAAADDANPTENHISAWDVTPDFAHVAVVFDNVRSDPGGFRAIGSHVYVVDVADGRTWRAGVTAAGERITWHGDGFSDTLLEHVSISPSGDRVVFGPGYTSIREVWTEVTP